MRRDWGSIANVRRNVWRLRYWAETDQGYRRCSETVRGTRKQAGDRLAELRIQHAHDAPCPTLDTCWKRWYLPDRERMVRQGDLAQQSLEQYCSTWRRHVAPRWAIVPVDQVRPLDIQQWLLGLKRVAAEASLHLLRQVLDYATRYGFIETNPTAMRYLLPSHSTVKRREDGVWTPEELGQVWQVCWGDWIEPAVLLLGFGGCRVGEALGVRASDVRGETIDEIFVAFVRIERQIDSRAREANRTKNRWSTRTALLVGRPAQRLVELTSGRDADAYLTQVPERNRASQKELRLAFRDMLEQGGTPVHLLKNLRKTWQTNARWVLRLPPWVVEPMMGHVGSGVTAHHYDKPSERIFADVLVDAWRAHPFADEYPWLREKEWASVTRVNVRTQMNTHSDG